ncbi:MAG: hypothetical protein WDW38_000932 [Sanguina aurantia]
MPAAPEPAGNKLSTELTATGAPGKDKAHVAAKGVYELDDHMLSREAIIERYKVGVDLVRPNHSQGLSSAAVLELRAIHGLNQLSPPYEVPAWLQFLKQFTNPLMMLLLVAGLLAFMAYGIQSPRDRNNLILAIALIVVVAFTCTMSFIQERSASNVMASLKSMMPSRCSVFRDGAESKVDATQLVPGDLVECSSLTGESDLIPASVDREHDLPAEARNIVFMSSLAMSGEAYGVVVRTGDHTFIGAISSLATVTHVERSTLQVEVHRLVWFIGCISFASAITFFVIGVGRKMDPLTAFVNGFILVIVANVPEGLPATVTSCLTLTAQRLREKHVLIKRTDIVENLGCASVIASDKTGTLTQNKMSVEHMWVNCELHPAAHFQPAAHIPVAGPQSSTSIARLSRYSRAAAAAGSTSSGPLERLSRVSKPLAKPSRPLDMLYGRTKEDEGSNHVMSTTGAGFFPPPRMSDPGQDDLRVQQGSSSPVGWLACGALDKLLAVALVCNKARYEGEAEGGQDPDPVMSSGHSRVPPVLGTLPENATDKGGARPSKAVAIAVPTFQGAAADRKILGDATDCGLLRYCERLVTSQWIRARYQALHSIPFNSTNKWALTVTHCPGLPTQHLVMMKGAPEILITKCSSYLRNGQVKEIDAEFSSSMNSVYERCGMMGERVLGFAYRQAPAQEASLYSTEAGAPPTEGLTFLGLISLVDPPRDGVGVAVAKCRTAGIRVMMVTGDHPLTAEAIARKVGIITLETPRQCWSLDNHLTDALIHLIHPPPPFRMLRCLSGGREVAAGEGLAESDISLSDPRVGAVVVTGARLRELTSVEQWDEVLDHEEVVFARTSPQQKLQIVENLQRRGEVVAVTGDGVNDSPALKRAQIGIAMGLGGSDVAREAADIVLLNDDFTSIVMAIEEGRVIYDNLKKTIAYTLTHAMPEVFPIFLNLALSFPLGLGGLMILTVDLITEQGPAISLAYEHAESSVMERPPRDILTDRLIDGRLLRYSYLIAGAWRWAAICMIAYFTMFWWHGVPISQVIFSLDRNNFIVPASEGAPMLGPYGTLSPLQQQGIYWEAQNAWYVTLVMCQLWHIFVCKSRQVSVFKHGLFKNPVTCFGLLISILVICLVSYIPQLHSIFGSNSLPGIGWLPHLGFLAFILPYTELSKYLTRRNPHGWWARSMQW